jgi:glucosamine--fructose-6-phosphate aminotransferase (isomerizing)
MCGIFAVLGRKNAPQMVLSGLKNLEYRGYDSWGVGTPSRGHIFVEKQVGKISQASLSDSFPENTLAIGHTRWATHGGVTFENAHPHYNEDQKISVAHNGIIENFTELRKELCVRGHVFSSDTDTEVLCHLIEEFFLEGNTFLLSVKMAADRCEGRFAFVAIRHDENRIIALRKGSPLILGIGTKGDFYLASDTPAFIEYTQRVHYIDDEEIVDIFQGSAEVFSLASMEKVQKREVFLETKPEEVSKGDHAHFMIKEIYEQKETLARAINQDIEEIEKIASAINLAHGTFLIGCGTAHKVAAVGEYFFATVAKKHINTVIASEFPLFHDFLCLDSLVIAISQSGETADVIEAIEAARNAKSKVLSVVNSPNSTVARLSDFSLHIQAGPEKAVASTKATTSQLAVLLLLSYACAGNLVEGRRLLVNCAAQVNDLLNPRFIDFVSGISRKIASKENIFIIGKGANFPIALESGIKIQEVSYIHAEGFAGGELKHGPIAMIEQGTPCIVLVGDGESRREILSNAIEIKSRGGHIIGIASENSEVFHDWIRVPNGGEATPLLNLIPVQILAYFLALERGFNPDMPRNLAKSVTVK